MPSAAPQSGTGVTLGHIDESVALCRDATQDEALVVLGVLLELPGRMAGLLGVADSQHDLHVGG